MRLLIGLLACAVVAYAIMWLFNHFFSSVSRDERAAKKARAADLTDARKRERIATQALRRIANGSGKPDLEAQIALDEIDATYDSKENT